MHAMRGATSLLPACLLWLLLLHSRPGEAGPAPPAEADSCRRPPGANASGEARRDDCPEAAPPPGDRPPGLLRPSHLPPPAVFAGFDDGEANSTFALPGGREVTVATGSVSKFRRGSEPARASTTGASFSVMEAAVGRDAVGEVVELLRTYDGYDVDPDSVDGFPSYEFFLDSESLRGSKEEEDAMKPNNRDPERRDLARKIRGILDPYLEDVLTPFVRARYPEACGGSAREEGRECTPCYSLIRRYRHGERQSHATHHDGHALATVVVSLSDYGKDYRGGLYVSSEFGQHEFLALHRGDAVVHQSSLLHGVRVYDLEDAPEATERFSWILWYRDSAKCEDYSHEWFARCASEGDAMCQEAHSNKIAGGGVPGLVPDEVAALAMELLRQAAGGGSGSAAIKLARASLKVLPSPLPYDEGKARTYYEMAIGAGNPDGHYGMAHLILASLAREGRGREGQTPTDGDWTEYREAELRRVARHLEEAARAGHAYGAFNLGIAHVYGYGVPRMDEDLGGKWFVESGLPEGYFVASVQAASVGDGERERSHRGRAKALGYFTDWRRRAREFTGSGGARGVDLNLPWPVAADGRTPPTF